MEKIINKDEMIIKKSEFEALNKKIAELSEKDKFNESLRNRQREECETMKRELAIALNENKQLKFGTINFIKILGGLNG